MLREALQGSFEPHQRFLVAEILAHIDYLEETESRLAAEIEERMRPFEEAIERLDAIAGVGKEIAQAIIAETGTDMSRFPSERHLCAWAGVAPGNHESAGKRKGGKTRKGNQALRRIAVQAGHAAGRAKKSYLSAQYHRLSARRGKKRAALAVGHSILVIVYHLLSDPQRNYTDLGADYFVRRDPARAARHHVKQLMAMGFTVSLSKEAA
jgi:transposase